MVKGAKQLHERAKDRKRQGHETKADEAEGLPFDCCALSLAPWTTPVMAVVEGNRGLVFELSHIAVYIKKHGLDPVLQKPLAYKDLVRLHWTRNDEGQFHCPITFKVFTQHSRIGAIRETGNVYSLEAIENLCIRPRVWRDPLSHAVFAGRGSLISIQNAHASLSGSHAPSISSPSAGAAAGAGAGAAPATARPTAEKAPSIRMSGIAERILQKAEASARKRAREAPASAAVEPSTAAAQSSFSSGQCAASLTSTAVTPQTSNAREAASAQELQARRYRAIRKLKKKAYVRLETTHGNLNLEIYSHFTPQTAENFLGLAEKGYYDGTGFHRLIPGFMVQGGDPTGTGRGGESLWGKPFPDELDAGNMHLKHSKRGLLSMANSAPNTNRSQFFITLAPCTHLDRKHTVFGRVVGGLDVLDKIEAVKADKSDRPREKISVKRALVFVNPIREYDAQHRESETSLPAEDQTQQDLLAAAKAAEREKHDEAADFRAAKKKRQAKKQASLPPAKGVVFQNFSDW